MDGGDEGGSEGELATEGRSPSPPPVSVAPEDVSTRANISFYLLAFFAFWFGSARFDADPDGDFDAADVQAIMNRGTQALMLNFRRPFTSMKAKRARRQRIEAKMRQREVLAEEGSTEHQEIVRMGREMRSSSSIINDIMARGVIGIRKLSNVSESSGGSGGRKRRGEAGVTRTLSHISEASGGSEGRDRRGSTPQTPQENENLYNLRQSKPWFTIVEVLICFGLWVTTASNTRAYALLQRDNFITDDLKLMQFVKDDPNVQVFLDDCKKECTFADETCVGIGWKSGPWPECFLLSSLPTNDTAHLPCQKDSWGWRTYAKQTWNFVDAFFTEGGAEAVWPGFTTLAAYNYCHEGYDISFLWRWWSYQFTHGSITHVGANCFMLIMLGIPLEGWQGTCMFAAMWTIGVLGGAFCWALFDPYANSYGASGGCYALLGIHASDLVRNWADKKWRFCTICIMLLVAGVESAAFRASRGEESSAAHAVHVGGIIAGLLIFFTFGGHDRWKTWEYVCSSMAWAVAAVLLIGSTYFWFFFNEHPGIGSLWKPLTGKTMERPFCWIGYVCIGDNGSHCPLIDDITDYAANAGSYTDTLRQCVMCDTRECVEGWYNDVYEVTTAGVTTEHYRYCPTESSRNYCTFTTGDSFDLWYPPTKSAYQLTDTLAPSPAPTPQPTD